ncbi:protein phosphatase inhibitor 2-like isoform X2 [Mus musculus]|uniref:protein phosphatase inhibitor 2-like isoform X2 n=1 Tax=Mus musculus TaxID=10090 RepID=UPI0016749D79|nr:protein phosphatase inhibitor 2-like isoform X2 [Mus musculus]
MEKPESLAPVSGLSAESPGGVSRAVPGSARGMQTDTGLPPGVALLRGPGSLLHSGNPVVRSPGPIQPSEGAVTLNSGPAPQLQEVASLGSSTSPGTGTGATKASTPGPEEAKVYSSESSTHSGTSFTERPRSILKNSSSILIKKPPGSEKKSQRWDEMNILATYHPADKDYGFMKADEPRTPYHRLQDTDEDPSAESSLKVTPQSVAERFATMDNFLPKVLQYGDNKNSKDTDNFAKTYSATYRNQFPSASDSSMGQLANLQRKEYYSKGRYLRSGSRPELGEDIEDEEQDSPSGLTWVTENPKGTPVNGSQVTPNCWAKGPRCRSPGSSEKEHGSNQNPPSWNGRRREPGPRQGDESLRLQWTQKKERRPWKM